MMDVATIGLIEDEDILLDQASLALSHLDHESTDIAPYLERLEKIEDRVCDEGRSAGLSRERATMLSCVLHGEFGFFGDTETYDAPVNADFSGCLTVSGACRLRCRSSMWDGAPMCSICRAMCWSRSARRTPW
jgi:hypothetical protein